MLRSLTSRCLRRVATLCLALLVVALAADIAASCPSCAQALGTSKNHSGGDIVGGYMWSIIFMISMPFTLLGLFGLYCYLQIRKAGAASVAATSRKTPAHGDPSPLALQD